MVSILPLVGMISMRKDKQNIGLPHAKIAIVLKEDFVTNIVIATKIYVNYVRKDAPVPAIVVPKTVNVFEITMSVILIPAPGVTPPKIIAKKIHAIIIKLPLINTPEPLSAILLFARG